MYILYWPFFRCWFDLKFRVWIRSTRYFRRRAAQWYILHITRAGIAAFVDYLVGVLWHNGKQQHIVCYRCRYTPPQLLHWREALLFCGVLELCGNQGCKNETNLEKHLHKTSHPFDFVTFLLHIAHLTLSCCSILSTHMCMYVAVLINLLWQFCHQFPKSLLFLQSTSKESPMIH